MKKKYLILSSIFLLIGSLAFCQDTATVSGINQLKNGSNASSKRKKAYNSTVNPSTSNPTVDPNNGIASPNPTISNLNPTVNPTNNIANPDNSTQTLNPLNPTSGSNSQTNGTLNSTSPNNGNVNNGNLNSTSPNTGRLNSTVPNTSTGLPATTNANSSTTPGQSTTVPAH